MLYHWYSLVKNQRAFSLIEVLLAFLIVAFLIGFSTQAFRKKETTVKSTFEEFKRLNQRLISLSHLRSQHYRLVFNLSTKQVDQYWVEKKVEVRDKSPEEEESQKEAFEGEVFEKELFEKDESFYSKPATLASFLDITEVETQGKIQQEGELVINYTPSTLAQETRIRILRLDNQARWTLFLDPVSKQFKLLK